MYLQSLANFLTGWPLILVAVAVSVLSTVVFRFVQVRYFIRAWQLFFSPREHKKSAKAAMTPVQALLNALNSNLGNGTIAGVATSLAVGGPGAAIWLLVIGLLLMAVRFAEVFLSTHFGAQATADTKIGGPMLYLSHVPGGSFLPYVYAGTCFIYGLVGANLIQTNSITLSIQEGTGLNPYIVGTVFFAFVLYIVIGGAERILAVSEKIVPLKIALFAVATIIMLVYYWQSLIPALTLMIKSAFSYLSLAGGTIGFAVQQAMRAGIVRVTMATEAGLGTSAIIFGGTQSKDPVPDAIMSMLGTFITTIISFTLALCIVSSNVWSNGLQSTPLTMAAYTTVFGAMGNWIVIFLSASFGIGSLVAYAYVARQTWLFLTKGAAVWIFGIIYCCVAFLGCIVDASVAWNTCDLITVFVLFINLYGIVFLMPIVSKALNAYINRSKTSE